MKHSLILTFCFALLANACGGGAGGSSAAGTRASSASAPATLHLVVAEEESFSPEKTPYNTVDHFVITVSGEGLASPLVQEFAAGISSAEITGISEGAVVDVKVEAFNPGGVVFKRGVAENVQIDSSIQEALLHIRQVPIFVNAVDGGSFYANRLRFVGFADPDHSVSLLAKGEDGEVVGILDSEGRSLWQGSADTGLFNVYPSGLEAGDYTLTLLDGDNRESTSISVTIEPALNAKPLQFTSGGTLGSLRIKEESISHHLGEVFYE